MRLVLENSSSQIDWFLLMLISLVMFCLTISCENYSSYITIRTKEAWDPYISLSHTPGLRTCLFSKISNAEAHARYDMHPKMQLFNNNHPGLGQKLLYAYKGMRIITSRDICCCYSFHWIIQVFEVWSVEREAHANAFPLIWWSPAQYPLQHLMCYHRMFQQGVDFYRTFTVGHCTGVVLPSNEIRLRKSSAKIAIFYEL